MCLLGERREPPRRVAHSQVQPVEPERHAQRGALPASLPRGRPRRPPPPPPPPPPPRRPRPPPPPPLCPHQRGWPPGGGGGAPPRRVAHSQVQPVEPERHAQRGALPASLPGGRPRRPAPPAQPQRTHM